jgi:DNA alkylation repair enzyme
MQNGASLKTQTPAQIAGQFRRFLKNGGTAEHAAGVQWFFKQEIKSCGWYTADLRRASRRFREQIRDRQGPSFLIDVADQLFSGRVLEEKIGAIFLLEKLDPEFGDAEFKLFESWLDRISSWSDHDALVHDRFWSRNRSARRPLCAGRGRRIAGIEERLAWR